MKTIEAPRRVKRPPLRGIDALALEVLLQAVDFRGLMRATSFRVEWLCLREKSPAAAVAFMARYDLLERISRAGLLAGTDLQLRWCLTCAAYASRMPPRRSSRVDRHDSIPEWLAQRSLRDAYLRATDLRGRPALMPHMELAAA